MSLPSRECGLKLSIFYQQLTAYMSLPSRECGLKSKALKIGETYNGVTPFAGVWIEITEKGTMGSIEKSHSLRGSVDWNFSFSFLVILCYCHSLRGSVDWNYGIMSIHLLQYSHSLRGSVDWNSSYSVDVNWIDSHSLRGSVDWNVNSERSIGKTYTSLPSRECGLKSIYLDVEESGCEVTPFAGVWIEIVNEKEDFEEKYVTPFAGVWIEIANVPMALGGATGSLPSRECGLKSVYRSSDKSNLRSLPSRECGLKFANTVHGYILLLVTPFAGVWIEMEQRRKQLTISSRHSLRGSVDWNIDVRISIHLPKQSLPSRECGLKFTKWDKLVEQDGHSLRGSVDWNEL